MTPPFFKTHPRACAVILASSKGTRLFPLTTADVPKHLLPVAGVPAIVRLLDAEGPLSAFPQIVVAVAADDTQTLLTLVGQHSAKDETEPSRSSRSSGIATLQSEQDDSRWTLTSNNVQGQAIDLVKLSEDCFGPIDALRQIEIMNIVHPETRMVVFPGDLVILNDDKKIERYMLDALIRPPSDSAIVAMLVDVLEQDEHGHTLKESAKAKKGGLSRDEEDIEYIAVAFPSERWTENTYVSNNKLPQILFKKPKQDVESDEDMTGSTAKLSIPNARLRGGTVMIRTEWSDVMVYSMAPWVRKLIVARIKNLSSLQEDLLPLLIARQHRGKRAAFGKAGLESLAETSQEGKENEMDTSENDLPSTDKQDLTHNWIDDAPYCVHAILLPSKSALRSNTIAAYLFACKEAVASGKCLPEGSKWNGKFQTLTLKGTTLGGKINMKSTVVGENCSIGDKCRLNNVVIMDEVMLGENCSLQNTIVSTGSKLGPRCSFNDCQVGPWMNISAGAKEKGEALVSSDVLEGEVL